jgi:hypothetical protein
MALVMAGAALSRVSAFGARPAGARRARMERSPQWRDGKFRNAQPIHNHMWLALQDLFHAGAVRTPAAPVPTAPVDPCSFATDPATGLRITWLGHSSLLLELEERWWPELPWRWAAEDPIVATGGTAGAAVPP